MRNYKIPPPGKGGPPVRKRTGAGVVLTLQHQRFVEEYMRCGEGRAAAIAAGYARAGAHNRASLLLRTHKGVRAAIEEARQKTIAKAGYNLEAAFGELGDAITFAKQTENATAYARCVELRAKLFGLLVERQDVRQLSNFQITISGVDSPKMLAPVESKPLLPAPAVQIPELPPFEVVDAEVIDEDIFS